jgi:hypothetical protein
LVAQFGVDRSVLYCAAAGWTVAELLQRFIAAQHAWSPATRSSHVSTARWLMTDPVGAAGVAVLTPSLVDTRIAVWRRNGASAALIWARWAVLSSSLSWASRQGVLRANPLRTMKAPPRPLPRKHLRMDEIAQLLRAANTEVEAAFARASLLSHRFARLRDRAALPDASLLRFRHAVATSLVEDGKIRLSWAAARPSGRLSRGRLLASPILPHFASTLSKYGSFSVALVAAVSVRDADSRPDRAVLRSGRRAHDQ